jgi:excisionase family DNA binding protein
MSLIERGRCCLRAVERAALLAALPGLASELNTALVPPRTRRPPAVVTPTPPASPAPRVDRSMPIEALPNALRFSEVADYLGIHHGTARGMADRGELATIQCGRLRRVTRNSLARFLDGRGRDQVGA